MPKTIRQTLLIKLQQSQTLADFRADLHALAGIDLRLVSPACKTSEISEPCSKNPLCERLQSDPQGQVHCRRFVEGLVLESKAHPISCKKCDAGLVGMSVPLKVGGETIGFLLTGGYRTEPSDQESRNRARHFLDRMNLRNLSDALDEFDHDTEIANEAKHEALGRWLQMAASALIRSLNLGDQASENPLPAFIIKICSVIQQRYEDPPNLTEAAKICDLSEGYFSRAFHEHTGLRFVEYIHAVRLEHVCERLMDPNTSITTVAFEAGFNSLSQFNRVFRKMKGVAPRQWRKEVSLSQPLMTYSPSE